MGQIADIFRACGNLDRALHIRIPLCQDRCRVAPVSLCRLSTSFFDVGFPGLRSTTASGSQLRVAPLQRLGCCTRAAS
ncbi:hypothetical protein ThidrDRAFT_4651 [Thiorhodococcus drewsii AZ1]|uniref:Uncharacterized protein n=1 Tax=Thiorhodococcus drewsii AZ1 TaxID=765913 RepID=G2E8N7_9GAMM|nr:hypothetical protein ThidrDRAFT_4651 [Thiorhodococcus drewsii AZ1]